MTPAVPPSATAQRLHGGAQRQPIRWVNVATAPMTVSRYKVEVGDTVSLHVHTGKAEYWVIVAGEGVVRLGDDEIAVREGDVVVTPPHVPHALRNTGTVVLDFLNLVQPVGGVAITTTELCQ
jgi:mannose-6-phosphate isomerase-like protein (cupin superfamily)